MALMSFALLPLQCYGTRRDLHSFPTRRSSDLRDDIRRVYASFAADYRMVAEWTNLHSTPFVDTTIDEIKALAEEARSEEHTSELQSPMYLVCRLLLEKKKRRCFFEFIACIRRP